MSFEQLHSALQYHIVNSIGWPGLREVQERCIEPIMAGQNIIVQAHTAGGKTEAAFFPLISEMLAKHWQPISILYISPLRALLNNQEHRLRSYFEMVGHVADVWHGDTGQGKRKQIRSDPPSCLLTTPESIEGMLVSKRTDHRALFANVQAVVIDEVHAFAGDDRGWHLQAVLARLTRLAGHPIQRIGLSATVGNAEELADWLNAGVAAPHPVVRPSATGSHQPEVQLDYVGNLANAAKVIASLHRGEKRLVFTDSRSRCEDLGARLREQGVRTFVTHSSLSRDVRMQTEQAFAEEKDCVIVATSALELGIDIGDLDRVLQLDAPTTVASFLQRMGRTGRRKGTVPNCLFLATDEDQLVAAAALIHLWTAGYVEPVIPPPQPVHLLAQQIMALMLQEGGIARTQIGPWLQAMPALGQLVEHYGTAIIDHMVEAGIVAENDGLLWFDERGEAIFGRKNFLEVLSVFTSAPLLEVIHGRSQIATVDQLTFFIDNERAIKDGRPTILTLGGRQWAVEHVNYRQRQVHVVPSTERGRSRWLGPGTEVGFRFAHAHLAVYAGEVDSSRWSRRATERLQQIREDHAWLQADRLMIELSDDKATLWTFAGTKLNRLLMQELVPGGQVARHDAFSVTMPWTQNADPLASLVTETIQRLRENRPSFAPPERLLSEIKFHEAVPRDLLMTMLALRLAPEPDATTPGGVLVRKTTGEA